MANVASDRSRFFKTKWFSREARKAFISDRELCGAIRQVVLGQAVELGGGVFKKRLGKNLYRSILVAKGRRIWVFVYLFAKRDQANISAGDLMEFRALADLYARKTDADFRAELDLRELMEICQ